LSHSAYTSAGRMMKYAACVVREAECDTRGCWARGLVRGGRGLAQAHLLNVRREAVTRPLTQGNCRYFADCKDKICILYACVCTHADVCVCVCFMHTHTWYASVDTASLFLSLSPLPPPPRPPPVSLITCTSRLTRIKSQRSKSLTSPHSSKRLSIPLSL
jgi:hypothetical protein